MYLRVTWEIMDRLLDILDIITAVKAEKRQFSIIISIVSKVAPKKKKKHMFGCKMRRKRGTVNSQFPPLPRVGNCPVSSPFLREPTSNGGRDINGDVTTIFQHLFISAVIIIISC